MEELMYKLVTVAKITLIITAIELLLLKQLDKTFFTIGIASWLGALYIKFFVIQ